MKKMAFIAALVIAAGLRASVAAETVSTTTLDPTANEVRVGLGVACDTEGQIERYAALIGDKESARAIQIVNEEAKNPRACGTVAIAYRVTKQVTNVRNEKGMFSIIQIVVVAASAGDGWLPINPQPTQYIAVRETEA